LHPNIPTRTYSNRIHRLFTAESTKKIKRLKKPSQPLRTSQGTWARSNIEKAHAFGEHLANVFQLHPSENVPEEEEALYNF
jgi:hypothetical protein